ncbi:carboxymuconolactone decarboxylase family protein [Nocardia sp. NPDC050793]|uniref:carboxymuconolactone decarboxylase family protein n=1 Tax=Nocardia sp. NPDC050793 TaxID=3155159 RepID=UPI003403AFE4
MPGLPLIEPEIAPGPTAALFDAAQQLCGLTPNLIKTIGNSPAALRGYVDLAKALRDSAVAETTRARIAVLVAQENRCDYMLSAHSFLGTRVSGLTDREAAAARDGVADDPKEAAVLAFAGAVLRGRGAVTDDELATARITLTAAEIVEVVAQVALGVFGNYVALVGRVANDWPLVRHDIRPDES